MVEEQLRTAVAQFRAHEAECRRSQALFQQAESIGDDGAMIRFRVRVSNYSLPDVLSRCLLLIVGLAPLVVVVIVVLLCLLVS